MEVEMAVTDADVMEGSHEDSPTEGSPGESPAKADEKPKLVTITMGGRQYHVAPEIAADYNAEVERRVSEAITSRVDRVEKRVEALDKELDEPASDDEPRLPDANLMYSHPEEYTRQMKLLGEQAAERQAKRVLEEMDAREDAKRKQQVAAEAWARTVDQFYKDHPDLNNPRGHRAVNMVWKELYNEIAPLKVEVGLARLATATKEFMNEMREGGEGGGSTPKLVSSNRTPSAPPKAEEPKEPQSLSAAIRKKQALFRSQKAG